MSRVAEIVDSLMFPALLGVFLTLSWIVTGAREPAVQFETNSPSLDVFDGALVTRCLTRTWVTFRGKWYCLTPRGIDLLNGLTGGE